MNYEIIPLPADSDEITEMTTALHQDLEIIYGKGKPEEFIEDNKEMLIFFAVKDENFKSLACGALKHFDDKTAEIKRMYVKNEFRGKGLSKLILKRLEETAYNMSYRSIILETGLKQRAAMLLYEKSGYTKITPYGRHKDDPDSVCYEKKLF
jgi:GNAT superfamily N-acetyltransferase